jgi:hypothetical protein
LAKSIAIEQGAEFRQHFFIEFKKPKKSLNLSKTINQIATRSLLVQMVSFWIRSKLNPASLEKKQLGTAINYYFEGETNLDPNKLYMYYNNFVL